MPRTTLRLAEDVIRVAKAHAARNGMTLGEAVNDLVRKGAERPLVTEERNGLQVMRLDRRSRKSARRASTACATTCRESHPAVKAALLDLNILTALLWPAHEHHNAAHRWFAGGADASWATCALTQLGFVRIVSNPAFSRDACPRRTRPRCSPVISGIAVISSGPTIFSYPLRSVGSRPGSKAIAR